MNTPTTEEKNPHLPSWPKIQVENRGNCPLDFEIFDEAGEVKKFMWGDPADDEAGREKNLQPIQVLSKSEWSALYERHGVHLSKLIDTKQITLNRG